MSQGNIRWRIRQKVKIKKVVSGLEASYTATSGKKSRSYSFPYGGDGGIEVYHTMAYRAAQTSPR